VKRLSAGRMLLYAAASVGTGAFYGFNNFVLPPVLQAFGAPDLVIGLLSSTRSLEGALIQPTVGVLSDRTWTRLGRRRPFMLVGVPLSAILFVAAAYTDSLLPLAVLIFLFSIFFNLAVDPYNALLPDIAPVDQRGRLSGLATGVQLASSVGFLVVVAAASGSGRVPGWVFALVAVTLVVSFGVTVVGVPELYTAPPRRVALKSYLEAILSHRHAVRYLGTLFVYQFGLNAIVPYLVLFVTDDIHASAQTGFLLSATLLLVMAVSAVAFGRLADRVGPKAVLAFGWSLLAVSAVTGVLVQTLAQTVAVVVVAGIGNGAATAANWPLLTDLIPPEQTGVFAGLKAAAESIAIPLSVVVAAEVFLPRLGYRGIFAMLAVTIIVALTLLLRFVDAPAEAPEAPPMAAC
jgi:maltose/moltooligosaccharide transporter